MKPDNRISLEEYRRRLNPSQQLLFPEENKSEIVNNDYRELSFIIRGTPIAKQSVKFYVQRINKGPQKGDPLLYYNDKTKRREVIINTYIPAKQKDWVNHIKKEILQQLPSGFQIFKNAVHVISTDFIFPPLKNFTKSKIEDIKKGKIIYKYTQPDIVDNLAKGLFDGMQDIVYVNDGLIASEGLKRKFYAMTPGIIIHLKGK